MNKENKNLKLYPKYRQLSIDYLFFYTINILFLTQIKKIDISDVLLSNTFYALFIVILQMPTSFLLGKIGIKKGMILGNICSILYLFTIINSSCFLHLVIAELISAMDFSIKNTAEPAMLNESINATKEEKSKIFARIQGKAVGGYFIINAFSMIISGFLFEINGYLPLSISIAIAVLTLIISTRFDDVESEKDENIVPMKEAIKFCFESKRIRCLLIFSGVFYAIITVLATYEVSLLEDLHISSKYVGIIFAGLNVFSSIASKNQNFFQEKLKNRTLTFMGLSLGCACIISGIVAKLNIAFPIVISIILLMYVVKFAMVGLYNVLVIKYLSNFTNSQIDTRIFAINSICRSMINAIIGIFGSLLIKNMITANAMIIFGAFGLAIITIVLFYMKNKVGLDPKEYSEIELKYDAKV